MLVKKEENETQEEKNQLISLLSKNKAMALSFAVALALSNFGLMPDTLASGAMSSKTVLEKEKEGTAAEREWQEEEEGYGNYSPGSGYYYRPWIYTGSSGTRSTTWASAGSKKTSSVGGYHISKGSAAG